MMTAAHSAGMTIESGLVRKVAVDRDFVYGRDSGDESKRAGDVDSKATRSVTRFREGGSGVISKRADVVVVGGGPAGASAATHLARAGLDVLLLDKAVFPREKACAEYCSPGVVDALDDLGALDRVLAGPHRALAGMRVATPNTSFALDFRPDREQRHCAIGVKRSLLDAELLRFAEDAGVRVEQGVRVSAPIISDGRVIGVKCGNDRTIAAEFVVAADGLHSTISRALEVDRPVRWPLRLGLVARYTEINGIESFGEMHVRDHVYCGFAPVSDREVNVGLVVPMGSKPRGMPTAEFFERTVAGFPGMSGALRDARRCSRVRGLGPLARRVRRIGGDGYLLTGDAAGFFDPFTGEGIHRALRGGEIAATAAIRALGRPDRFPECYASDRRRQFGDKERVCHIVQILLSFPGAFGYASRRIANRAEVNRTLAGVLGDYAPAAAALRPRFLWRLFKF
jgi:menaquinone-9 beta-reductase